MPNDCINELHLLSGEGSVVEPLERFMSEKSGERFLDFEKIIPAPDCTKRWATDYDPSGVIEWRIRNWGTKWNSYSTYISDDGSNISFATAWDTPIPVIKKLAKLSGIDLRMLYVEYGMSFCGELKARAKSRCSHRNYNICDAPQDLKDDLNIREDEDLE